MNRDHEASPSVQTSNGQKPNSGIDNLVDEVLDLLLEQGIRKQVTQARIQTSYSLSQKSNNWVPLAMFIFTSLLLTAILWNYAQKPILDSRDNGSALYALYFQSQQNQTRGASLAESSKIRRNRLNQANELMTFGYYEDAMDISIDLAVGPAGMERDQGQWFLALLLIRENNFLAADSIIHHILLQENHGYFEDAVKLHREIRFIEGLQLE